MIKHEFGTTTIKCDKCGFEESADSDCYNEAFFESGWTVSPRAKKYSHLCYDCKTPLQRRSADFVKAAFPPTKH